MFSQMNNIYNFPKSLQQQQQKIKDHSRETSHKVKTPHTNSLRHNSSTRFLSFFTSKNYQKRRKKITGKST